MWKRRVIFGNHSIVCLARFLFGKPQTVPRLIASHPIFCAAALSSHAMKGFTVFSSVLFPSALGLSIVNLKAPHERHWTFFFSFANCRATSDVPPLRPSKLQTLYSKLRRQTDRQIDRIDGLGYTEPGLGLVRCRGFFP